MRPKFEKKKKRLRSGTVWDIVEGERSRRTKKEGGARGFGREGGKPVKKKLALLLFCQSRDLYCDGRHKRKVPG